MIVKEQKPIKFVNSCGCIVDYQELEKAIIWYQKSPTMHQKKIYLHGNYPAVSVHEKKLHVHRLLMMYWFGGVLPKNMVVHHLNENKLDARKQNLAIMCDSGHAMNHLSGVEKSSEHRKKISHANQKRAGMKMKKRVEIPFEELKMLLDKGKSINAIAKIYNCDWSTVKNRIHENSELSEEAK